MITILGSGGHGWHSLSQFINNNSQNYQKSDQNKNLEKKNVTFNFVITTTDWGKTDFGGFTGTWGRILELETDSGKTNNEILHPIIKNEKTQNLAQEKYNETELTKTKQTKKIEIDKENNQNILLENLSEKLSNYEPNDSENNSNYEFPTLPFGDVNKIIGYFWLQNLEQNLNSKTNSRNLQKTQQKLEKSEKLNLDLRSDDLAVLLDLWEEINDKIDAEFGQKFEIYLSKALQIYQKTREKLNLKARNPSLLHFWHTFLLYQSTLIYLGKENSPKSDLAQNFETKNQTKIGSKIETNFKNDLQNDLRINWTNSQKDAEIFAKINQIFNNLCHTFGILPSNVLVSFGDFERRVLVGSDGDLTIIGEENLDEWPKPILPQSFAIKTKNLENPPIYKPLLKDLENSDLVIIPTGSVANWLGFVNNPQVLTILKEKNQQNKVVWIQNSE